MSPERLPVIEKERLGFRLEPIQEDDLEFARQMRNKNRTAFLYQGEITPEQQRAWYERYQESREDYTLYVAWDGEERIGTTSLKKLGEDVYELGNNTIDEPFQGRGYFSKIYQASKELVPGKRLAASVLPSNSHMLTVYEHYGFVYRGADKDGLIWVEEPSNDRPINLLRPSCSEKETQAVQRVIESGWWGLGPVTAHLEKEFAERIGAQHAVAVNSCTSALHLALKTLPRKEGGNIICPALTFISTAAVGVYEGYEVRFADIDERTLCIDREDVLRKADERTVAIIPVHYAGRLAPTDFEGLPVIEDCAHAAGTPGSGREHTSCWSFHPVKNLATGDGGMVTTNDPEVARRLRSLCWMGIDKSTWEREKKNYNWEYDIQELGYKYHGNDILSSIALEQLRRLDELNGRRREIAARYNHELAHLPLALPPESGSWHLYVVRMDSELRNRFLDFMRANQIAIGVHYKPLHLYPAFQNHESLPVTDRVWTQLASLPIHPDLTDKEQERVISKMKQFFHA